MQLRNKVRSFFTWGEAEVDSKYISSIDGFGSFPLTHSLLPAGNDDLSVSLPLQGVQLLTRYYEAEKPYWPRFVLYYKQLGVEKIHVCVQTESDRTWLKDSDYYSSGLLRLHLLNGDVPPNDALKGLDLTLLRDAPFTLMVDCDEFIGFQAGIFKLSQLLDLYPDQSQWHLPWLMCPLPSPNNVAPRGFWGHVGKPIVRSELMKSVENDHLFSLVKQMPKNRPTSIPLGVHGVVIVHFWGRSFFDTLIKIFINSFEDAKSVDKQIAIELIQKGEMPVRLRLLAYLDLQRRYLPLGINFIPNFCSEVEIDILERFISRDTLVDVEDKFCLYREKISIILDKLPRYPSISIMELASILPSLKELG